MRRLRATWVVCFAACALVACDADESSDAGTRVDAEACAPSRCEDVGAECGAIDDGCGGELECGACPFHQICGIETPNVCGGECTADTDCGLEGVCDLASATCTDGCRTGSSVFMDVPLIDVELDVLLDGAPLPDVFTDPVDIALHLRPISRPMGGSFVPLYETDSEGDVHPVTDASVALVPGRYEVRLVSGGDDALLDHFPANGSGHVRFIDIDELVERVVVDIPRVAVTLETTLDGAALPSEDPGPTLRWHLVGDLGDARVPIYRSRATLFLLPDRYTPHYESGGATGWPVNRRFPLDTVIDVSTDETIVLDVPTGTLTVELLVDGAAPPTSAIEIVPEGDREREADATFHFAGGATRSSALVLRGDYASRYVGDAFSPIAGLSIPAIPTGAHLRAFTVVGDGTLAMDLPTVGVDLRVRVLGWTEEPTAGPAELLIGGRTVRVDADAETTSVSITAIPGRYEVRYVGPVGSGTGWPALPQDLPSFDVGSAGPIDIDLRRRTVELDVTLAGDAGPPLPGDGLGHPHMRFVSGDERVDVPLYSRDVTQPDPLVRPRVFLLEGTYDVDYVAPRSEAALVEWPALDSRLLYGFVLDGDRALVIDVPRVMTEMRISWAGRPLPSFARADRPWRSPPELVFERGICPPTMPECGARLDRTGVERGWPLWGEDEPVAIDRFERWLVPGAYLLRYGDVSGLPVDRPDASVFPPLNSPLGCWRVTHEG